MIYIYNLIIIFVIHIEKLQVKMQMRFINIIRDVSYFCWINTIRYGVDYEIS